MSHTRLALTFCAALSLTAFGLGAQAAEINLYSARHYDSDKKLAELFTQKTGIEVKVITGSAEQLIERLKREGESSPADVFVTVDINNLWRAAQEGVLQPTKAEALESVIPANLRDPQGRWFAVSTRARVLVVDPAKVDVKALKRYEDLADPKYKGQVLVRTSTHSYNQSLVASMIEADGLEKTEAWAKGLVANLARAPKGGDTDQIRAVAAGEGAIAISNSYYLGRMLASDNAADKAAAEKLAVIFPNQEDRGTHINISGAGVAKNAPNRENALKYIEFLVSPEAQAIITQANYEFPVRKDVPPVETIAPWAKFKTDAVNLADIGKHTAEALKLTDRAGWR